MKTILIVGAWGVGKSTLSHAIAGGYSDFVKEQHPRLGNVALSPTCAFWGRTDWKNGGTDSEKPEFGVRLIEFIDEYDGKLNILLEGNKIYGKHVEIIKSRYNEIYVLALDMEYEDYLKRRAMRSGGDWKDYDTEKRYKNYKSKRTTYLNLFNKYKLDPRVNVCKIDAALPAAKVVEMAQAFLNGNPYAIN